MNFNFCSLVFLFFYLIADIWAIDSERKRFDRFQLFWLFCLLFDLFISCPDIFADEGLAHHLHDGLSFRVSFKNAPRVFFFLFRLVADGEDLDVAEVEELLLGKLRARVRRAARRASENVV